MAKDKLKERPLYSATDEEARVDIEFLQEEVTLWSGSENTYFEAPLLEDIRNFVDVEIIGYVDVFNTSPHVFRARVETVYENEPYSTTMYGSVNPSTSNYAFGNIKFSSDGLMAYFSTTQQVNIAYIQRIIGIKRKPTT